MPSSILRCNGQTRRSLNLQPRCSGAMFLRGRLSPFQQRGRLSVKRGKRGTLSFIAFCYMGNIIKTKEEKVKKK